MNGNEVCVPWWCGDAASLAAFFRRNYSTPNSKEGGFNSRQGLEEFSGGERFVSSDRVLFRFNVSNGSRLKEKVIFIYVHDKYLSHFAKYSR